MKTNKEIDLSKVVGKGYASYWNAKERYRVLKGGRGSKKSTTTALWYIYNMMKHKDSNTLVVRKTFNTHKDSTFAELKKAAKRLGVYDQWKFTASPLECVYLPTRQKILFRGYDDPLKLTSITVETGVLCWVWLEEAYEIDDESDFDILDESIRGEMPDGLWKQLTLTYNPWVITHWTKKRFFDNTDPNAFTLTTTYKCNEFLDDADRAKIDALEHTNPDRYRVVGLGEYGLIGGQYFPEFKKSIHVIKPFDIPEHWQKFRVFDYGLDMLALYWFCVDTEGTVYFYREHYEPELIVSKAVTLMKKMTPKNEVIRQTFAPPDLWNRKSDTGKSTADIFKERGITLYRSSNSRVDGWLNVKEWLEPFETVHEQTGETILTSKVKIVNTCVNLIRCLPEVQCDEKNPNDVSNTPHELTHSVDAFRYGLVMRIRASKNGEKVKKNNKSEDKVNSFMKMGRR